jgi:hypothetical protein
MSEYIQSKRFFGAFTSLYLGEVAEIREENLRKPRLGRSFVSRRWFRD